MFQFLFPRIIATEQSKINGEIRVIEQFRKRTILVGGLQQSGDLVEMIWRKGIEKVASYPPIRRTGALKVTSVLILGLGGGSAVKVVNKYYPDAKIIGIDIDPVIVKIGKEFMHLGLVRNLTIRVADAFVFVQKAERGSFDLVLVDLYIGKSTPAFLESDEFLKSIKNILSPKGLVICNRLRGKGKEQELAVFKAKLEKIFGQVTVVTPLINSLFIASK